MIAVVFPGQGSQRAGMGASWVGTPSWRLVDEASEISGRDVARLLVGTPDAELTRTDNAQLATFVVSLLAWDHARCEGLRPTIAAGHSLGEYTALVAAGIVAFADGVRLVAARGDAMRSAADEGLGTMAAVLGLEPSAVEAVCRDAGGDAVPRAWVANDNGGGQVVIAGTLDGVEAAATRALDAGARKVLRLPVGGAFHSPLMAPAADRLRAALASTTFHDTDLPVVANVDAQPHHRGTDWPPLLTEQLCRPVRWRESLQVLGASGVTHVVELGPGTALSGMVKRVLPGVARSDGSNPDAVVGSVRAATAIEPIEGEHLHGTERVVVSPAAGVFRPDAQLRAGIDLTVGEPVGRVGDTDVRSPFRGRVEGVLALDGERVTAAQPIAWLRSPEPS